MQRIEQKEEESDDEQLLCWCGPASDGTPEWGRCVEPAGFMAAGSSISTVTSRRSKDRDQEDANRKIPKGNGNLRVKCLNSLQISNSTFMEVWYLSILDYKVCI